MSLDYEFSPIDVNITTHPKAFAAGVEAMGLWLWGMAHARQQKTKGGLSRAAVLGAWGGRKNAALAKRLVDAGLWVATDDGWEIWNFDKKGAGRTTSSAERMRRLRDKRKGSGGDGVTPDVTDGDASLPVTSVTSCSTSNSLSSGSDLGSDARAAGPPPWFGDVLGVIAMGTGVELSAAPSWLRYEGHRAGKGIEPSPKDAQYWLTTVLVREVLEEREKLQHRADREAKWDKERKDAPPKPYLVADTKPAPYHGVNPKQDAEREAWAKGGAGTAEQRAAASQAMAKLGFG